ncbi:LexA family transcriptional regulator [Haliscomenobacter sp.]|uniref:LexA family transcriptional regulator n=1 Tax=Haliscomenobacter sp. TaxID=2717303 RepID=UPI0033651C45
MNSIVTQRFIQCHHQLKQDNRVRSSRQFAIALEYLPQSLSEILKGRRDVTIDLLRRAVEVYQVNPLFLYTGEGDMFLRPKEEQEGSFLTVAQHAQNEDLILHVSIHHQYEYPREINTPEFISKLPVYSFPELRSNLGTQRSFEMIGDSMQPTFNEGDKVIANFVKPTVWTQNLKNNHVYVIVSDNAVVIKRILKGLQVDKQLLLVSDNSFYESYPLHLNDVKEIWQVHTRISSFLPAYQHHQFSVQEEIKSLKEMIGEQHQMIQRLQSMIEKLIKS